MWSANQIFMENYGINKMAQFMQLKVPAPADNYAVSMSDLRPKNNNKNF